MIRRRFMNKVGGKEFNPDNYLTIEARANGLTAKLSTNVCEYSTDGTLWVSLPAATATTSINAGEKLYFRATGLTPTSSAGIGTFTVSKSFNLSGNVMSMLFGDNVDTSIDLTGYNYAFYKLFYNCTKLKSVSSDFLPATTLASYCYYDMFYGCTSLTRAPKLPATTLASYCYYYMFSGCTSLTQAPELPATTLATYCYDGMFSSCTSLTQAPELPATKLATSCYYGMFSGCTSLTQAPELPATKLTSSCYRYMFQTCTALTQAPELPATTLASNCYNCMFYKCTSLTQAPELPATKLTSSCYYEMFSSCTSLTQAPELPATKLATYCYDGMFSSCTKLNYIKAMFTTTPSTSYTNNWVYGVASTGTFIKNSAATWDVTGTYGVPEGWTVQTV